MRRALLTFMFVASAAAVAFFAFFKLAANGFSAREKPTAIERFAARAARSFAIPGSAKSMLNPAPNTPETLADARVHWADHCAGCHANNGSGDSEMGPNMYPPAPDMRKSETQNLTDGEIFFVIENGIRLTGMPGWGGSAKAAEDSWKLVRFIRHLPQMSAEEEREMRKMNPRTPAELREEQEEEEFLKGNDSHATQKSHSHH